MAAPFQVDNRGRPAPPQPFQLTWPPVRPAARAQPASTERPWRGPLCLGLAGGTAAAVDHVLFYVDAVLIGYDTERPVPGGAVDVGRAGPGEHASQAIVFLADGRILTVNATFRVP